jgi:hypothetical protein
MAAGPLGAAYGTVGAVYAHLDWGPALLGAGLTTLGGLLPDLDSDSGVPVRELFGLMAAATPFLILGRLRNSGLSPEQILVILGAVYVFVRYGVSEFFKQATVHRGMFHSLPALCIAGLVVFLLYDSPNVYLRMYLAGGVMAGFFSHLLLDELYAVDFNGVRIRLNNFAGSALKLFSPSWIANTITYSVLFALAGLAWLLWDGPRP